MRIKQIKSEHIVLILAWVFWGFSDVVSWKYYDPQANLGIVVMTKAIQFSVAIIFNFIIVFFIVQLPGNHLMGIPKVIYYSVVIIISSILTVICNSTIYNYILNSPILFLKFSHIILYALQKIIYFTGFTTLFFMIRNLKELQKQKQLTLEAKHLAAQAQVQMLQQQMNPHFLFNTLNSLRSLIAKNTSQARDMVTRLSDLLRESLQYTERGEILLSDELKFLENYVEIQKIRFNDDLLVEYHIDENARKYSIPAFILQPLVENAIKHGMKTGVSLVVKVEAITVNKIIQLSITNNGKIEEYKHAGLNKQGIDNIKQRLHILYNGRAGFSLTEADGWVMAKIEIQLNK